MKAILKHVFIILLIGVTLSTNAQTWIWYPGDYEIWLGNKMNNRRTERGTFFPPLWKTDSHYVVVEFSKKLSLTQEETIYITAEGVYNVKLDGKLQFGMPDSLTLPAGNHRLNIKIWNQATPPALFVKGRTVNSGPDWKVTNEDKEWIDESGKASDTSTSTYMSAGYWNFNTATQLPSQYQMPRTPIQATQKETITDGTLYDFGKETFGYLVLSGLNGKGDINIYYGESREEALDKEHCETLDCLTADETFVTDHSTKNKIRRDNNYTLQNSKAFRYVYITTDGDMSISSVSMEYEYAPVTYRGTFRCNDEKINKIWDIGAYTMHLTTREFFIDGIKRDRWVWSGDALQSYLMNYYLFFDNDCVKRTTWLLRGKDPISSHINTIMDYTFYWFIGIYDYYLFTGDDAFVKQIYPRMQSLMQYVLGRTNQAGMVEGLPGDWVFVDWADGFLDKRGELAIEQILFCKSLETMVLCATICGNNDDTKQYTELYHALKVKLLPTFWNDEKKALVHNRLAGKQSDAVTRYANMFATLYDYLSPTQKEQIKHSVLLNDSILKITTPYMRFYELEALCALGEHARVLQEIIAYWGGMLDAGATSFWEKYNPDETGTKHLAMYGRPYGKSLCHAWGASPIYLLGKYYLGIKPVKAGYSEWEARPVLGGLKWMEGSVPTPYGAIDIAVTHNEITITSDGGKGYLYFKSSRRPKTSTGTIEKISANEYRLLIDTTSPVKVKY